MKNLTIALLISILFTTTINAQKRSITIDDYARFRSISSAEISDKGSWAGFTYETPRADDTLIIKSLLSDKIFTIPNGSDVQFSDNEKWAAYKISPSFKKQESLKLEKKPVPVKAGLINLETGEKEEIEEISSFMFTKGSNLYITIKSKPDPKAKTNGKPMIIRELKSGLVTRFENVSEVTINKSGSLIAFAVETADTVGNGLFVIATSTNTLKALETDKLIYSKPTWNEEGTVLACLKGITKKETKYRSNSLLAFTDPANGNGKFVYDPTSDKSFPEGWVISENRNPSFNTENALYYFGIKEQEPEIEKKKDAPPVANVDIWHWQDERIQSVQKLQANRDRQFTYLSAVNTKANQFVRIADSTMRMAETSSDGKWVIGRDDKPYISDYKESLSDYYRVDPLTGVRTLIIKGLGRAQGFSPDGKNYLLWKDGEIWNYILASGKFSSITKGADVEFANQEFDRAATKPPYGVAGWTSDGKSIIIYSRYDLWLQPLSGASPTNITNNYGSENEIVLRYIQTNREEKYIDIKKPLLL
jgi:hypothetical protein